MPKPSLDRTRSGKERWIMLLFSILLSGMLSLTGWAEDNVTYSPELVKKAEMGDASAQCDLGLCYSGGIGVPLDQKQAVKWYRKAAERGNAYAQVLLGVCLSKGNGTGINKKEAVRWITKSAEQGDAIAQFNLGCIYRDGLEVPKDMQKCVMWWTRAAEQEGIVSPDHLVAKKICRRELEKIRSQ